jgi:hypothetical protein
MVLVPQLLRWAFLVHTTFQPPGGDFLGAPRRRLLWAAPFVVLFHPLPYVVAGSVVVATLAMRGRTSAGWLWFLVGFYACALLMGIMLALRLLSVRRRAPGGRDT